MKKRLLVVLLACALSVNLAACGSKAAENGSKSETSESQNKNSSDTDADSKPAESNSEESKEETDTTNPEDSSTQLEDESQPEETSETIYNIGDSASLKDWTICVTDAQIVESITADYGSFSPDEEGNKYIQVFVTVNNDGKQADTFLPMFGMGDDVNAKILYADGYEFSATNLLGYSNELHDSTINPLSSQTGEIAFEIPSTVSDSEDELLIQFSSGNDLIKFKIR